MSPREIAKLGRACGRLDSIHQTEVYGLAIFDTEMWQEWPESMRRLWEFSYYQATRSSRVAPRHSGG